MHCESTLGKTSRNISRLPKQVIVRNQIYDKAIGSPQWQLTETHSDLTTGTHQVSKSCRPAPQKGVASKNRKTSTDGLLTSLADKLYLYKTKQSNSARAHTHTARLQDLYWTSACYILELHCGSAWLKGVLETVHAHYTYIHISRAVKLSNVAKHACCLITWLWSLWCGTRSPNPPTSTA